MALKSMPIKSLFLILLTSVACGISLVSVHSDGEVDNKRGILPEKCTTFFGVCEVEMPEDTVEAVAKQFTECCAKCGHSSAFCQGLATETFSDFDQVSDSMCQMLVDLELAHEEWAHQKADLLLRTASTRPSFMMRSQSKSSHVGFDGTLRQKPTPTPSPASVCNNGEISTFTCTCNAGYTGDSCDTICSGHGSLDVDNNCQCQTGWTGTTCEVCDFGYSGANCDVQCNGHGTLSSETCTCSIGFSGTTCEQCSFGYSGSNCDLVCNGNGNLTDGRCECDPAWEGQLCENYFSGHCYEFEGTRHSWGPSFYNRFRCKVWRNGNANHKLDGEIHVAGSVETAGYITNYPQSGVTPPYWAWYATGRSPALPPSDPNATVSCVIPGEPSSCAHCASTINPDPRLSNRRSAARGYQGHQLGASCTAYDAGQHNGLHQTVAPALFTDGKCKYCRSLGYGCIYGECSMSPPCNPGECGDSVLGEQCWPAAGASPVTVSRVCPGNYNGYAYSPMTYGWFPMLDLR